MNFLESIFKLLESNKKFPYYQAERRIDIFINFFIEDIIRQHTIYTDAIYVAAEFPLRKSKKSDHAAHIDYLMYSALEKSALLVELKTDDISYKPKQIEFYFKHSQFKDWHNEFELIKMKGFKNKKEFLRQVIKERLGEDLEICSIKVIVLKPTLNQKDYAILEEKRNFISFIGLKNLNIKTEYQEEWEVFRRVILNN